MGRRYGNLGYWDRVSFFNWFGRVVFCGVVVGYGVR